VGPLAASGRQLDQAGEQTLSRALSVTLSTKFATKFATKFLRPVAPLPRPEGRSLLPAEAGTPTWRLPENLTPAQRYPLPECRLQAEASQGLQPRVQHQVRHARCTLDPVAIKSWRSYRTDDRQTLNRHPYSDTLNRQNLRGNERPRPFAGFNENGASRLGEPRDGLQMRHAPSLRPSPTGEDARSPQGASISRRVMSVCVRARSARTTGSRPTDAAETVARDVSDRAKPLGRKRDVKHCFITI